MSTEDGKTSKMDVQRRTDRFARKISTRIWEEEPSPQNPYINHTSRCHGYDIFELMKKRSYMEVMFLLFKGELPGPDELELFEKLAVLCINPGPRHPAARAAMNAGVGKTDIALVLPIGLTIMSGAHLGAGEIEPAMRWLRKHTKENPAEAASNLLQQADFCSEGDLHICPGFGSKYGGIDEYATRAADELCTLAAAGEVMRWADTFSKALAEQRCGWLITGLVAAVLADLGFQPRMGAGIYQLLSAPGLFAHGAEMSAKPLTAMPFPDDSEYFMEFGQNND
jgi:citrate synthase